MDAPLVRDLGLRPLPEVWAEMQAFTAERTAATRDEIWFVEHPPVYTLGMRADRSHLLAPGDIPVVQIDRGGQVTYHGPGQLVAYVLLNLRAPRVDAAQARAGARERGHRHGGGLRRRRRRRGATRRVSTSRARSSRPSGCASNGTARITGLAVNVAMDLAPFQGINPCGYEGLT